MSQGDVNLIEGADWPLFGWRDDVRAALAQALAAGRDVALATLFRVDGSAPRGPGAQMLFDGTTACGYFTGDCIEGDVARHAAGVLADGHPRRLHYGTGSPWIDIRLRCGGALHILVERVGHDCTAAHELLGHFRERRPCVWHSDGLVQRVDATADAPLLALEDQPLRIARRYDPVRRLVVSGGDPAALAIAQLGAQAQFETTLVRPGGPPQPPPLAGVSYRREDPPAALARIGVDRWMAFVGATHEDQHDLAACLYALRYGAAYVGMIGAKSRVPGRQAALRAAGASEQEVVGLRFSPGITGLGKAPWAVATGIVADILQVMNPAGDRA